MAATAPLKKGFKQMLAEANAVIDTISVHDALKLVGDSSVLFVDIREAHEVSADMALGALHAPRGFLEFLADPESPMHKRELSSAPRLILYCATGGRSALAAKTLLDMGYTGVFNMAGGMAAWKAANGPLTAV
jgi:rhodanese-related sulfurtransferase